MNIDDPTSTADQQQATPTSDTFEAAELIIRYIEHIGCDYVFGVPGGAIEPLYNALARGMRRNSIKVINACHETGAAFMADGYFRETGKLSVCIATSGPGATNLITGVSCAYDNNIPMLIITGQPPLPSFGKGALQESSCTGVNILSMFRHCTRYNSLVSHPNQLETKLVSALLKAKQLQGPVHLSIPVDILRSPITDITPSYNLLDQLNRKPSMIDKDAALVLAQEINKAEIPLFFIGAGAIEAIDVLMELINKLNIPFITTPDGKGLINPQHPNYHGVFGLGGHSSAMNALRKYNELIIAFGTGFDEFSSSGWSDLLLNQNLIHVDAKEEHFIYSPMAKLHVSGSISSACRYAIEYLSSQTTRLNQVQVHSISPKGKIKLQEPDKYQSEATPIKPQRLMKELSTRFPFNTRFVADAGNSMIWAPHYLTVKERRLHPSSYKKQQPLHYFNRHSGHSNWLSITMNFAPMGWAIGASIGIAQGILNNKEQLSLDDSSTDKANQRAGSQPSPTVCITGDGSYLMSGQEITAAARENLPVVFVVLNDSVYGMVMHGQRLANAEPVAFELPIVNYKALAESMNIPGHIIQSPEDFDLIDFDELLSRNGPTLLDVRIDREEVPPMGTRLETLGSVLTENT